MDKHTQKWDHEKKNVHAVIEKLGDKIPKEAIPRLEEAITKIVVEQVPPRKALGMTPEMLEVIYQQGYLLFQSGKYDDALVIFNVLRLLDVTDARFTFAIAGCYHMKKEYLDAAANYLIYHEMDALNPIPPFHLYDCFNKAHYPSAALMFLQEALVLAGMDAQYSSLRERIQLEADHFHEEFKKWKEKQQTAA